MNAGSFRILMIVAVAQLLSLSVQAATVVEQLQHATVRIVSGKDRASGVIVSTDGDILTVAHGISSDAESVTIILSDGRQVAAQVIQRKMPQDVAHLRLNSIDGLALKPLPVRNQHTTSKEQVLLAAGYPGREDNGKPVVVRLGRLVASTEQNIRSTCLLTAGDSGGPLVDGDGYLVGIHRQIGRAVSQNLHVPIDVCRDVVDELIRFSFDNDATNSYDQNVVSVSDVSQQTLQRLTVTLAFEADHSDDDRRPPVAIGTRISANTVVSKLSLVADRNSAHVTLQNVSDPVPAILVRSDRPNDLAFWKLASVQTGRAEYVSANSVEPGEAVFSTNDLQIAGIVSRVGYSEPPSLPKLGVQLRADSEQLIVERVAATSAASDAQLMTSDVLKKLGNAKVFQLNDVGSVLAKHQPGDWLAFEATRDGKQAFTSFGQLRHDPASLLERSTFLDGNRGDLSRRRTEFVKVLQHDIPIPPHQIGGPLVDRSGRLIGINIARCGRESTLAVPIDTVVETERAL